MTLTSFEDAPALRNKKNNRSPPSEILAMDNPGTKYLGDFVANFGMSEDARRRVFF